MSHYAIIGVLQEQGGLGRWILVHDFAEGPDDGTAEMRAVSKAFARQPPRPSGERYPGPFQSVRAYTDWLKTLDWNFWHIATVELSDGLPLDEGNYSFLEDIEQVRRELSGDTFQDGTQVPHLYVVVGQGGGGDAWAQRFRATSKKDSRSTIDDWFSGEPRSGWGGVDWEYEGIFATVEEVSPGHYRIYNELGNLVEELKTSSPSAFDPKDVEAINRHRRRIGGDPIDLAAGWSPDEIREMADNIRTKGRTHNPRLDELKRKLMR